MRGKSTRGYVLKVAVASASIGCAALSACESQHPVGTVASPPQPIADATDASANGSAIATATAAPTPAPTEVGTVARAPDVPDAGALAPRPTPHKVGLVARPPDHSPTVGTTAHAPDSKP